MVPQRQFLSPLYLNVSKENTVFRLSDKWHKYINVQLHLLQNCLIYYVALIFSLWIILQSCRYLVGTLSQDGPCPS
jgi:hypothetical protein